MSESKNGRTLYDALIELLSSWKLVVVALIAILSGLYIVHNSAEPGTEISYLYGLVKYNKAKPQPLPPPKEPQSEPKADIREYILPSKQYFPSNDEKSPILDGTLSLQYPSFGHVILSGVNLTKIKVAGRTVSGDPLKIRRFGIEKLEFAPDCWLELQYKGNFFGVDITDYGEAEKGHFRVITLQTPTLDLKEISAYYN